MQKHYEVMNALQNVARAALALSSKFNTPDYAQNTLLYYSDNRKNNAVRSDVQQQVCDIRSAFDDVVRLMEREGYTDVLKRYEDASE